MSVITGISIYNFRSIQELENIRLKPLTIFIGPNASGKSSILYAIYWMALKARENPSLQSPPIDFEKGALRIQSYDDLVLGRDLSKKWIGIKLEINVPENLRKELLKYLELVDWSIYHYSKPEFKKFTYGFKIHRTGPANECEIETEIDSFKVTLKQWFDEYQRTYRWSISIAEIYKELQGKGQPAHYGVFGKLCLDSYVSQVLSLNDKERRSLENLDRCFEEIFRYFKSKVLSQFFLLTSLRGNIPFKSSAKISVEAGFRGDNTLNVFAYALASYDLKVRKELGTMITKWLERFGIKDFTTGLDAEEGAIRATYFDKDTCLDLAMGSYGDRQLATLIAQLIVAPKHSVVMIEEPEISLHPKAQILLPLLFADVIKNHEKQVIITTHSSLIPLALSDAILGSEEYSEVPKLNPEDVIIYHVDRDANGFTSVTPIELSKEGYPKEGIPSFTDVEMKLYEKMLTRLR